MPLRYPAVAGSFYPADGPGCLAEVTKYLRTAKVVEVADHMLGGVVPHAGWVYSGPTAALVYAALRLQQPPQTVLCFGAVHSWDVEAPSIYGSGHWRIPLGDIAVDEELAREVISSAPDLVYDRPEAHRTEHSIEVQLPFLKHLWPSARILPISVPPRDVALKLGRSTALAAQRLGRTVVAIGSSDLTHYGPRYGLAPVGRGARARAWIEQNDRRILDLMAQMRGDAVLQEAAAHWNACGAGAVAATIACVAELGARTGTLLGYTTSHDVMPLGEPTDMVGYGAVVFG